MIRIYVLNYNYGQYIRECVDSLIHQTDTDFAVTCIDNGSSDGSNDFLKQACTERGWRFEEFPNLPISHIGNHVARSSTEEFIIRLDADDTFCPHYIAAVKRAIAQDDPDIVYGNYFLIDYDSRIFSTQHILTRGSRDGGPIHDEPFHGACTAIRRAKLLDFGGYYEQFSRNDGYDLYLKFRKERLHHIAEPVFHYRRGHRSLSSNMARIFDTRIRMVKTYCADWGIDGPAGTVHVLAFPDHPDFYREWDVAAWRTFIAGWGRDVRMVLRGDVAAGIAEAGGKPDPMVVPWPEVVASGGLRRHLDRSPDFSDAGAFVVHSMSDRLAPLPFFEVAPLSLDLFESGGAVSGVKMESSMYQATAGGVRKTGGSSRALFDAERMVLHAGGLTAFRRGAPESGVMTLLELSGDMLTDGHLS